MYFANEIIYFQVIELVCPLVEQPFKNRIYKNLEAI